MEGSITTADDAERIKEVRRISGKLITIGACATSGGIQGLRNFASAGEYTSVVYANPEYIHALDTSTPISAHVPVDLELYGCPIDRHQLLGVVTAILAGRRPRLPGNSVCQECKGRGTVCLLVAHGTPCLGPVTRAGCGAICPGVNRGCFGCFGPTDTAEHRVAGDPAARPGHGRGGRRPPVPHLQRRRSGFPEGVGGSGRAASDRRQRPCPTDQAWGIDDPRFGCAAHHQRRRIARVEGEGSLRVEVRDGVVGEVALEIFEPPRYFEAMLVGRNFTEAPDITSRICGICPVAYQMSACNAMESALGVVVDDRIRALRRLLYCGEWIQSHALHVYLLHAPDFLGCEDAVELAERDRPAVERGLDLKRTGNLVMEAVGAGQSTPSTSASVASTAPRPRRRSPPWPSRCSGPATRRWRRSTGWRASSFPMWKPTTVSWRSASRTATPSSPAGPSPRTVST